MVQEMLFKDKTRDHIHARDAHLQKKKTIQMHTMWTNIVVARKKTVS
jgi:hypothetical protein